MKAETVKYKSQHAQLAELARQNILAAQSKRIILRKADKNAKISSKNIN